MASEALRALPGSAKTTALHKGHARLVVWLSIGVLIGLSIVGIGLAAEGVSGLLELATERIGAQAAQFDESTTTEVVVRKGDSLWSLAQSYGPGGHDLREVVDWIRELNGLTSASIHVGQVLIVPIEKPGM